MSVLTVELKPGESVRVDDALIRLEEKRGQRARLVITAPSTVKIERQKNPQ